jgi:hypothetical protein
MPKRIAVNTIILHRAGVGRVRVPAGKLFDFTAAELETLKETAPDSIRTPRNEVESVQEVEVPKSQANQGGKGGKGGKQQQSAKVESKPEGDGEGADAGAGAGGAEDEL